MQRILHSLKKSAGLVALAVFPSFSFAQDFQCQGAYDETLGIFVVSVAEVDPEFPGGVNAMVTYIRENLELPDSMAAGEPLTTEVEFVVDVNGNVIGAGIPGKAFFAYSTLDRAVMKMVLNMPKWAPGTCNGTAFPVRYRIPINIDVK